LNYKYRAIFKFKRNRKKLIDGIVKIEKYWKRNNWENTLYLFHVA
jgi:hypothetical protein